ncbi:hypothetical protein ABTW72_25205 [Micromonospora sp. NPDC127501]
MDAIHEVSLELDSEVAALLVHLEVPVPAGLSDQGSGSVRGHPDHA